MKLLNFSQLSKNIFYSNFLKNTFLEIKYIKLNFSFIEVIKKNRKKWKVRKKKQPMKYSYGFSNIVA